MQSTKKYFLPALLILTILLTVLFIIGESSNQQLTIYLPPVQTQTAAVADFNSTLVAHYTFDEGSGVTAGDSSGSGLNGTVNGSVTWGAGKIGGALSMNGTSNYVTIPSGASNPNLSTKSVSFWVKLNSLKNYNGIYNANKTGVNHGYGMFMSDGTFIVSYENATGVDSNYHLVASAVATTGVWQHFVVIYDVNGNSVVVSLYKNGVLAGSYTGNDGMTARQFDTIGIGNGISNFLDGQIDDFRLYSRVLTGSEISQLYALGSGGTTSGGGGTVTPPATPQICTSFTYSAWSTCTNGTQTQTVISSSPAGCTGGSPVTTQSCTVMPPTYTGTTFFIRNGATGNNSGSDWTNAYNSFSSISWQRGNIYYVASGNYSEDVTIAKPLSGTQWITLKKATDLDHGTDSGWQSMYSNGQAVILGSLSLNNGYIEVLG